MCLAATWLFVSHFSRHWVMQAAGCFQSFQGSDCVSHPLCQLLTGLFISFYTFTEVVLKQGGQNNLWYQIWIQISDSGHKKNSASVGQYKKINSNYISSPRQSIVEKMLVMVKVPNLNSLDSESSIKTINPVSTSLFFLFAFLLCLLIDFQLCLLLSDVTGDIGFWHFLLQLICGPTEIWSRPVSTSRAQWSAHSLAWSSL